MPDPGLRALRFPIGEFDVTGPLDPHEIAAAVAEIEAAPDALAAAIRGLDEVQLDTPYRPDGWSVRQVVHHLADSHLTSYVRLKLALTEDLPTIHGYDEAAWARLPDYTGPVRPAMVLLRALHVKWVAVFRALTHEQWAREFEHTERGRVRVDEHLAFYAWHGRHHVAHITALRARKAW